MCLVRLGFPSCFFILAFAVSAGAMLPAVVALQAVADTVYKPVY